MKKEFSFIPTSANELAERLAARVNECMEVLANPHRAKRFPNWVRKIGAAYFKQVLAKRTWKAIVDREEHYVNGFVHGMILSLGHLSNNPQKAGLKFGRILALKRADLDGSEDARQAAEAINTSEPMEIPAVQEAFLDFFKETYKHPVEIRAQILEGLADGSAVEDIYETGGYAKGSAFKVQVLMLLFWPEFEKFTTRSEACAFLWHILEESPDIMGSDERFIKLAQRYGYKSQLKGD